SFPTRRSSDLRPARGRGESPRSDTRPWACAPPGDRDACVTLSDQNGQSPQRYHLAAGYTSVQRRVTGGMEQPGARASEGIARRHVRGVAATASRAPRRRPIRRAPAIRAPAEPAEPAGRVLLLARRRAPIAQPSPPGG